MSEIGSRFSRGCRWLPSVYSLYAALLNCLVGGFLELQNWYVFVESEGRSLRSDHNLGDVPSLSTSSVFLTVVSSTLPGRGISVAAGLTLLVKYGALIERGEGIERAPEERKPFLVSLRERRSIRRIIFSRDKKEGKGVKTSVEESLEVEWLVCLVPCSPSLLCTERPEIAGTRLRTSNLRQFTLGR